MEPEERSSIYFQSMSILSDIGLTEKYLDMPFCLFSYPSCFDHLMLQFDVFHASIFLGHLLPILVDIGRLGVELRPFMIRLECELVCMSRNICFHFNS